MKCPICNDETMGWDTQQWGPEFAHTRCVVAYNFGMSDARAAVEASARKLAALERTEQAAMVTIPAREGFAAPQADALYFDATMPPVVAKWLSEHPPTNMVPLTASPTAQPSVEPVGEREAQLDFLSMTDAQVDDELKRLGIDPVLAGEMGASAVARALGSYTCRLCGHSTPHTHTPEEIIIFRNGMKAARSTPPPAPLSDAEILDLVNNIGLTSAQWSTNVLSIARAIEQAIGRASREAS